MTGSAAELTPVSSVDDRIVGEGKAGATQKILSDVGLM